jgi:multiple sugar transport system permease protein
MPVLTKVEAKSTRGRLFQTGVFLALFVGGATMVYPFLLMLSGSMRSDMDVTEMDLVPDFLTDNTILVRKFLETKYDYDTILMNRFRQTRDYSFRQAEIPGPANIPLTDDFKTFVQQPDMPNHWQVLGGTALYQKMRSVTLEELLDRVRARYNDNLSELNEDMGAPLQSWAHLELRMPEWSTHRFAYTPSAFFDEYFKLMHERPVAERALVNLTGSFLENIIYPEYGMSGVEKYNASHAVPIESYETFSLSQRIPPESSPQLRKEWLQFVFDSVNLSFVRIDKTDEQYREFLKQRFGTIEELRKYWRETPYESFDQITLPEDNQWIDTSQRQAYKQFLEEAQPEKLRLVGPEFAWKDWLRNTYGTLGDANAAYNTDFTAWNDIKMPLAQVERQYVVNHSGMLRRRYASRNFRIVFKEIFVQGRSFYNTMIFVCLAMLCSLTIQPLAAYSLSRFNPPGTWKFIFIFMATMAFPPMVSFIPMFLMIKKLGLLNTFIGLVLPVTINGYLIFLLKGFFDSIPKHLYEAATMEGASEMYMFTRITMSLSKPILAVVALNTFRMAWMSFMHPLIVCPDEKMHVLSVWLHQFQKDAPTSAVFASILIASFPTLLIFLFTQRTIMKGIAIPAEK